MKNPNKLIKIFNKSNNISLFKNLSSNTSSVLSFEQNTTFNPSSINTFNSSYEPFFCVQLSGRLRGVSMAKKYKDYGVLIENFGNNNSKKRINGLKPQTLDTCLPCTNDGSYRLQYIQKDIYTKWGIFGLKLWLYNKS